MAKKRKELGIRNDKVDQCRENERQYSIISAVSVKQLTNHATSQACNHLRNNYASNLSLEAPRCLLFESSSRTLFSLLSVLEVLAI